MTQPANSSGPPNPQRKNPNQPQPGIINDLPHPQGLGQSMIVNDVSPLAGAAPGGQMIINDMPTQAEQQRVQRMLQERQKSVANIPAPQQMIVNDMAFVDAGMRGHDPAGHAPDPRTNR